MPRKNPLLRKQRIGAEVQDQEEIEVSLCERDTLRNASRLERITYVDDESTEVRKKLGELGLVGEVSWLTHAMSESD